MRYALNLSAEGRILSATFEKYAAKDQPLVDTLPEGDIADYLYVNGEYVYNPLPRPQKPEMVEQATTSDMAAAIAEGVNDV